MFLVSLDSMFLVAILQAAAVVPEPPSRASELTSVVPEVQLVLEAEVDTICEAGELADGSSQPVEVEFVELSSTPMNAEIAPQSLSINYICNDPDGFTRVLTSSNGGFLVRDGTGGGASNSIAYFVEADGPAGLDLPRRQLLSPASSAVPGSVEFLDGQLSTLSLRIAGVRDGETTAVFAGSYSDTLTVSVTAN